MKLIDKEMHYAVMVEGSDRILSHNGQFLIFRSAIEAGKCINKINPRIGSLKIKYQLREVIVTIESKE